MRVVYGGLVAYAPGTLTLTLALTLAPALAAAWSVSPDGLAYRFRLRFSDGTSLTAATATSRSAISRRRRGDRDADARPLALRLKAPDPASLDHRASPSGAKLVGPDALVRHAAGDRAAGWLDTHSDGTGLYVLASVRPGQRITLARNPHLTGPGPYSDEIQIFVVSDISQQVLMPQDGELDAVLHGYAFDRPDPLPPGLAVNAYRDLGIEMAYVDRSRAPIAGPACRGVRGAGAAHLARRGVRALHMPTAVSRAPIGLAEARRIVAAHGPVTIAVGYSMGVAGGICPAPLRLRVSRSGANPSELRAGKRRMK